MRVCVWHKVEGILEDFLDAWASVWQIKFECKCSGISWQSVIKTLLCLMICFVNVHEWRVVCNSGGHLQKSAYPLPGGFEQCRCTYMHTHFPMHMFFWVDEVCHAATSLMELHQKAKEFLQKTFSRAHPNLLRITWMPWNTFWIAQLKSCLTPTPGFHGEIWALLENDHSHISCFQQHGTETFPWIHLLSKTSLSYLEAWGEMNSGCFI